MAMTPKQLNSVTLGEFEEMARRFAASLSVLREAQGLLGGIASPPTPKEKSGAPQPTAAAYAGPIQVTSREQAEAEAPDPEGWREGLRPDQQEFLESQKRSGERAALLAKIRGDS